MPEAVFHFAQPWWLLGLLLIFPVGAWLRRSTVKGETGRLHRYADTHLLPHLTGSRELEPRERWGRFTRWSLIWTILVFAMAGPRWDFTEIRLFSPGADLVILLDISRSMEVTDVRPNRLTRARQEIEDLINLNRRLRLGLIAFASVAHVVSPITEDGESIRSKLPALSTDLVRLQGSRLGEALNRARHLLAGQPEESRRGILLISDGDFAETGLEENIKGLAEEGIDFHILGIGTEDGGPVPAPRGGWIKDMQRKVVQSRLDNLSLKKLAETAGGTYRQADFRDDDSREVLRLAVADSEAQQQENEQTMVWNERFYWLLLPTMLLVLPAFRKFQSLEGER
jgi:Ca-activated chloride channel family protein